MHALTTKKHFPGIAGGKAKCKEYSTDLKLLRASFVSLNWSVPWEASHPKWATIAKPVIITFFCMASVYTTVQVKESGIVCIEK
jgi:hypothetical protein